MTTTKLSGCKSLQLCKKLYAENKKTLITFAGGYIGIWAVIGAWLGLASVDIIDAMFILYIVTAAVVTLVVTSMQFNELGKKETKIASLMTPANNYEKFIIRIVSVIIGTAIIITLGYLALYYSFCLTYPGTKFTSATDVLTNANHLSKSIPTMVLIESIYIFGSVAWPKKSFLKTTGVMILIQTMLITIIFVIGTYCRNNYIYIEIVDEKTFYNSIITIEFLISAIILYFSYRKFKTTTIA